MHWTTATVERKIVWAPGLFTLSITAPEVCPFEPGQFLQLGLTPNGNDKRINRPYSVASPHGQSLEFFIVMVDGGQLTPHLWALNPGDQLDVSQKAAGSFTLKHSPDAKTLWLLATGTGIAPYIAMLRTDEPWQRYDGLQLSSRDVEGIRSSHAQFVAASKQLAVRMPHRRHSRGIVDVPGALRGRITTCIDNGTLESAAGASLDAQSCVMMCGNPDMLDDTEKMLEDRGLKRHRVKSPGNIVVERYW